MIRQSNQPSRMHSQNTSAPSFPSRQSFSPPANAVAIGSAAIRFFAEKRIPEDKIKFFRALHNVLASAGSALTIKENGEIVVYHLPSKSEIGILGQLTKSCNDTGPIKLDSDFLMLDRAKTINFLDLLLAGASAIPPQINWRAEFPELKRYVISLGTITSPGFLSVLLEFEDNSFHLNLERLIFSCGDPQRQSKPPQ